ncbi:MAG: metal-dependent hydrolase [Proteobacteria bacterium]|jgi:inner membrane protein|nr:metal-dependent hydrolase [Pseudomonadota bacterium]
MDPLSQGTLGAIGAQNLGNKRHLRIAGVMGFLAGLSADLDSLIKSDSDPLLALEYHRGFTHSLIFIPIGGLICAIVLFYLFSRRRLLSFKTTYFYCTAGYATHALLDACTTYGTQLLWPFSNARIAWNTVSIIDPLFTLPLLALIIAAALRKSSTLARIALAWVFIYMTFGIVQRERVEHATYALAMERGHQPSRLIAMPTMGNSVVWKTVYEANDEYFVDGLRAGISITRYQGRSVAKYSAERDFPWLDNNSQQAIDVERFRWFTNDYIAVHPDDSSRIIDVRYSMVPTSLDSMWSVQPVKGKAETEHIIHLMDRGDLDSHRATLWTMFKGTH